MVNKNHDARWGKRDACCVSRARAGTPGIRCAVVVPMGRLPVGTAPNVFGAVLPHLEVGIAGIPSDKYLKMAKNT